MATREEVEQIRRQHNPDEDVLLSIGAFDTQKLFDWIDKLQAELDLATKVIHDLQQESAAYQRGYAEGRRDSNAFVRDWIVARQTGQLTVAEWDKLTELEDGLLNLPREKP